MSTDNFYKNIIKNYNKKYSSEKTFNEGFKDSFNDAKINSKYYNPILMKFNERLNHDSHSDYHFLIIIDNKDYDNYYILNIYGIYEENEAKKYLKKYIGSKYGELNLKDQKLEERKSIHITILDKFTNIPKIENSGMSDNGVQSFKSFLNRYSNKIIKI